MKKPTLEEVREYFKDAKVVKSLFEGEQYKGALDLSKLHFWVDAYWCDTKCGNYCLRLWAKDKGYAEIIEYKNPYTEWQSECDKIKPGAFSNAIKEHYNSTKQMKKVIRLDEPKEEKHPKPIELTHFLYPDDGWRKFKRSANDFDKVVYLGYCGHEKCDKFACYHESNKAIEFWKGHLNDGVY